MAVQVFEITGNAPGLAATGTTAKVIKKHQQLRKNNQRQVRSGEQLYPIHGFYDTGKWQANCL
ncbi:MAG TPA: hypothetical protein VLC79_11780 [Cellvibrio sp.]|nr:hypothetical protein [Cellvibrio sp.]